MYDSKPETLEHIDRVRSLLGDVIRDLHGRAFDHDLTKMDEFEKPIFDEFTPKLKDSTYSSDEYKGFLKSMKVALDHHYATYRHHPEHFENGIKDMNLIDLIEMVFDWKAASERHANGNIEKSIKEINKKRFDYGDEIERLLLNTLKYFDL